MMVGINPVPWRCVAPADCPLSQPVQGVRAHNAEDTDLAQVQDDQDGDRSRD